MNTTEFLTEMCPSVTAASNLLQDVLPLTNAMDYPAFGSFYCMLLEEWCYCHHENIIEVISVISQLIYDVNAVEGKYIGIGIPSAESEVMP